MTMKRHNTIEVPKVGQYVQVSHSPHNCAPVTLEGKCINVKWRGTSSTFTIITGCSKQTFALFLPNLFKVTVIEFRR